MEMLLREYRQTSGIFIVLPQCIAVQLSRFTDEGVKLFNPVEIQDSLVLSNGT